MLQNQDLYKKKIINKYNNILRLTRRGATIIFIIIITFLITQGTYSSIKINQITPPNVSEQKIISSIQKIQNQDIPDQDIQVYILQDTISTTGDHIVSRRNLLTYKGYTLPQYFLLFKNLDVPNIEYFQDPNYDIEKLEIVMQNILFTFSEYSSNTFLQQIDPPNQDIKNLFNISCIDQGIIQGPLCQQLVQDMIKKLPVYDLSFDHKTLSDILNKIANRSSKSTVEQICERILTYSLLNKTNLDQLMPFISIHCGEQQEQFLLITQFTQVEQELSQGFISNIIYTHPQINLYKLLSIQQSIYNDSSQGVIDIRKLESYIYYLQALIQRRAEQLNPFYIDSIYWFNNQILIPQLLTQSRTNSRIDNIITNISSLNTSSRFLQYTGLTDLITNRQLIQQPNNSNTSENTAPTFNQLVNQLLNASFFIPIRITTGTDTVQITGYFNIITHNEKPSILAYIELQNQENRLLITKAHLPELPELSELISNIIQKNKLSLAGLYQFINDNIVLYLNQGTSITLCDRIKQNIYQATIVQCNDQQVQIEKRSNGKPIAYRFKLEDYTITDLTVSDTQLQKAIEQNFTNYQSDSIRLPLLINEIIQFTSEESNNTSTPNDTEILRIIERVRTFMNIIPQDVVSYNNRYYIQFTINNVRFVGEYDLRNHIINPLFFQDVLIQGSPIQIQNFSLQLNSDSIQQINSFTISPLIYIRSLDPSAYTAYQQFITPR